MENRLYELQAKIKKAKEKGLTQLDLKQGTWQQDYDKFLKFPIEILASLTNLKSLDLSNIQLEELQSYQYDQTEYFTDALDGEDLEKALTSFYNKKNLENQDLRYNQLTSLPDSFGKLINLKSLNLSYNKLTSLPESLKNLSNLQYINVEHNPIKELPEYLKKLSNANDSLEF